MFECVGISNASVLIHVASCACSRLNKNDDELCFATFQGSGYYEEFSRILGLSQILRCIFKNMWKHSDKGKGITEKNIPAITLDCAVHG